ncbi:carboxymuconolactone decarboxylase family protein [Rhizorhapis sp. SPR117]|uniref:carboxymuconolactone decarboxylase family protein n=1 Tax=Rhizorhapis sp. SPR117 TaxID=2912611 RepID=UPI001F34335D|nr:carboxymuconolactone decarboxylase family protein [Rhizorhapis sp. SPR117]
MIPDIDLRGNDTYRNHPGPQKRSKAAWRGTVLCPECQIRHSARPTRINPYAVAPELSQAWLDFSNQVAASGLEKPLLELVKIRASQINGCAGGYQRSS